MVNRTIAGTEAFRIARAGLGRLACNGLHPADGQHDHAECIVDDASYIADVQLRMLAAVATGEDDLILDRLAELQNAIDPER